jgi:hypothetical protein
MKHLTKYSKSLTISVSFLFILLIVNFSHFYNLHTPDAHNDRKLTISAQNPSAVAEFNTNYKPLETESYRNSFSSTSRALPVNLIIGSDQKREFSDDRIFGNVLISDDATMIIRDCIFTINGTLTVSNNGRLQIINSTVYISPGTVDPQQIIISFSDNAQIEISESWIYTLPQPSLTNISYLLSDDNSIIKINDSYLNVRLPPIVNLDIEFTPPTAGTFILTGETIWNIQNSTIECFLYFDNQNMLAGRWFMFTLQRKATLLMKNSAGSMENDETQPFIKPVAGFVKLENCNIRKGNIDNEVVGELEAINISIYNLNLRDQSKTKIYNSVIINNMDLGSVAVFSPTIEDKPKATLYMEDTTLGSKQTSEGMLITAGNSSAILVDSSIKKCFMLANSKVHFISSEIQQLAEAKQNSTLTIENTSILQIFLEENSDLIVKANKDIYSIDKLVTKYNCKSFITVQSAKIDVIEVWAGDDITPDKYDANYEPDRNISEISISMFDTTVGKLSSSDDAIIHLTLQDTTLNEFYFDKFKEERALITILDLGSEYQLPSPWPEIQLEIDIYNRLGLHAQVNGAPVAASVKIVDHDNNQVLSTMLPEDGDLDVDLFYEKYTVNGKTTAGEYTVTSNYLGFDNNVKSKATFGKTVEFAWEDTTAPVINNISIDRSYQRTNRGSFIRATIIDHDVKVVANATIIFQCYKNNTWSPWTSVPMVEIYNNTFEGVIPESEPGTKIRFYIESYDYLGTKTKSKVQTYEIKDNNIKTSIGIMAFIIFSIIILILILMNRRRKIKKYLNKPKETDSRGKREES